MSAADIAVAAALAVCVISTLICCFALIIHGNLFEHLHYMAPVTTVSFFMLLIAVAVKDGWGQATIKAILVMIVLLLINSVLTHATARAARVRHLGHWQPAPEEHIEGTRSGRSR